MKKINRLISTILLFLTSANCLTMLAQGTETLHHWKAGETVSAAEVDQFGQTRCFEAVEIPDHIWEQMQGKTYKPNADIGRKDLRYLRLLHWDYDERIHLGEMICNAAIAHELVDIFRQLYQAHYPIQRMVLPDNYGADDELQMRANNSSCFCYRPISGTKKLSKHALGLAVDLNTLYNPYVGMRNGKPFLEPSTAKAYTDRSKTFKYKIDQNDLAGSKRLINFFDAAFSIGKSMDDPQIKYLKQIKVRTGQFVYDQDHVLLCTIEQKFSLVQFVEQGFGDEADHLKKPKAQEKAMQMASVKSLKAAGKSIREIAELTGISKSKVDRLLKC